MTTTQPVLRADYSVFPYIGGYVPGDATRIDSACFRAGLENEVIVEFWYVSGLVLKLSHNNFTGKTERRFIPVQSVQGRTMKMMAREIERGF